MVRLRHSGTEGLMSQACPNLRPMGSGRQSLSLLCYVRVCPGMHVHAHVPAFTDGATHATNAPCPLDPAPSGPAPNAPPHLQVCVLVVVDAHKLVACLRREVSHERRLAATGGALQQHRVLPAGAV
eukprot:359544-Chlamydomonas_euryale.AAC.8